MNRCRRYAHNKHLEPSRLPLADCGQDQSPKKTTETDAIPSTKLRTGFENIRQVNAEADANITTLSISIDTKATVNVGEYSRAGRSRGTVAVKALDHDLCHKKKLVPGGILEPVTGRSFLFFGNHFKTSDFMADGILLWWEERKHELSGLKTLVINLDNGPACSGRRSQFLYRMIELSKLSGLCIRLVYYPPYHSKYNSIERYWAGLEKSWNGYLLSTVDAVLNRAKNFFWKGIRTVVRFLDKTYAKGVKVCGNEKAALEQNLKRSSSLIWWDRTIQPKAVF